MNKKKLEEDSTTEEEENPRQERADRELSDFLGEEVKHGKVVEEAEETPEETEEAEEKDPEETQPAEEPPKEKEFDPDKLKDDIIGELDKRLPKETAGEEEEQESAVEKYLKKAKDEGRNPSWQEALEFIAEEGSRQAYERLKSEQEEAQKLADEQKAAEEAEAKRLEEERKQNVENFNQQLDDELKDLYNSGKLERIKDQDDPSDVGVIQRKALFQAMYDANLQRTKEGLRPIYSLKEVFYEHYKNPLEQPPGADAPVSLGKAQSKAEDPDAYSYWDIHGKDYTSLARRS